MDQIEIEILQGAHAGKSAVFDPRELSFGRGPGNDMVIDVPEVSREHGVLRHDEDGWKVINLSVNGTTVNGRPIKKNQRLLRTGDTVGVGKLALFNTRIIPSDSPDSEAEPEDEQIETTGPAASPEAAARRKQQIKMYLATAGVLVGLLFFALAIIAPLSSDDRNGGGEQTPDLSPVEIERIITKLPESRPSQRDAREALDNAIEAFENRELAPDNLYNAYRDFKRVAAYDRAAEANDEPTLLDSETYREFKQAEEMLVDRVSTLYLEAYSQVRSGQWQEAEQTCRTLQSEYRARDRIYKNAGRLLRIARRNQGR